MTTYHIGTGGEVCERLLLLHLVLDLQSSGGAIGKEIWISSWQSKDKSEPIRTNRNPWLSFAVPNLNDASYLQEELAPFAYSCTHTWSRTLREIRRGSPAGAGEAVGLGAVPPQQGEPAEQ